MYWAPQPDSNRKVCSFNIHLQKVPVTLFKSSFNVILQIDSEFIARGVMKAFLQRYRMLKRVNFNVPAMLLNFFLFVLRPRKEKPKSKPNSFLFFM
jgi:hypothetical protein